MAELSLEQVSATVLEILQQRSPLHQETIRDAACERHPGRINLVMIKQALARLEDQKRVEALDGGVWALLRSAQAVAPSETETTNRESATDRFTENVRRAAANGLKLDVCPACGGHAVLREFGRSERFECKFCRIVCCSRDGRPSGICALCEAARAITTPSQPPAAVLARAPKMKAWFASAGARETVWIGKPGLLRFFSSAVLIRASSDGAVLFERPLE